MTGPRLFRGIRPVAPPRAVRDALAGVTLAAMSVPQALGYARIAGTPVVTGLYTLLLPLAAFATFGSSRYLVVAADSATATILADSLTPMAPTASPRYLALAGMVALLTAGFLALARTFRLGFLADFLAQTVLVGFLTGVGFQVGIAVLPEMLGVPVASHRSLLQLVELARGVPQVRLPTVVVSAAVVTVILVLRARAPRVPGPLIAVVGAIAASIWFDLPARGIAALGPVAGGLPRPGVPDVGWSDTVALLPVAVSCFLMIVAQSAATARAWAARHGDALDEDADLVGLAAANAVAAASGTFVVNGSPTQTAVVESAGASSQLAHLVAAGVVALVLLLLTGPLEYLPRCALAAVVFTIAAGLVDVRALRDIRRESPGEYRLAVGTAVVVVAVGVEQGILLAMGISLLRHVRHSYHPHTAVLVEDESGHWQPQPAVPGATSGPGLIVFQFGADLFYANAGRFADDVHRLVGAGGPVRWLVVDAGAITSIDYSAARVLRALLGDLHRAGIALVLVHAVPSLTADLARHRLMDAIGADHVFDRLHDALAAIRQPPA